jgi:hypothetical protein
MAPTEGSIYCRCLGSRIEITPSSIEIAAESTEF